MNCKSEVCPVHGVACQRVAPHRPVKLRNPRRLILPMNEHFHHTPEGFCSWSA